MSEKKQFHLYEWGEQNPTKILFLHGLGNSGEAFTQIAEHLKDTYKIYSIDSPGHGKTVSMLKAEDYLFSNLAKWLDRVVGEITSELFYLAGHSWGADFALHYAKLYPNKIKGAILLDGAYTFPDFQEDMTFEKAFEGWEMYMVQSSVFNSWEDVMREYQGYTKKWNNRIEKMVSSLFIKEGEQYKFIPSKFTVLSIIQAFYKEGFTTLYPYIKAPVLLLHATSPVELDEARSKGITELRKHVKDVTVKPMEGCGHMLHWDDPEEVAKEIHQWIQAKEKSDLRFN